MLGWRHDLHLIATHLRPDFFNFAQYRFSIPREWNHTEHGVRLALRGRDAPLAHFFQQIANPFELVLRGVHDQLLPIGIGLYRRHGRIRQIGEHRIDRRLSGIRINLLKRKHFDFAFDRLELRQRLADHRLLIGLGDGQNLVIIVVDLQVYFRCFIFQECGDRVDGSIAIEPFEMVHLERGFRASRRGFIDLADRLSHFLLIFHGGEDQDHAGLVLVPHADILVIAKQLGQRLIHLLGIGILDRIRLDDARCR